MNTHSRLQQISKKIAFVTVVLGGLIVAVGFISVAVFNALGMPTRAEEAFMNKILWISFISGQTMLWLGCIAGSLIESKGRMRYN